MNINDSSFKYGVYKDDNGVFEGILNDNNKPHGFGRYTLNSNKIIEGFFFNMQVSGRCRVITEDGSYFNGELKPGEKLSSA